MTSKTVNEFSPELRARAVRLVLDHEAEHPSRRATIPSISCRIGCTAQTLSEWVKKAEVDSGRKAWADEGQARLEALERENREMRQANEILRKRQRVSPGPLSANARIRLSSERSSSADTGQDRVHRRSPQDLLGSPSRSTVSTMPSYHAMLDEPAIAA